MSDSCRMMALIAAAGWLCFAVALASHSRISANSEERATGSALAFGQHAPAQIKVGISALRHAASSGDPVDGLILAEALLNFYDESHDAEHLLEATLWLMQGYDSPDPLKFELSFRIFNHYCDSPAVYWLPLCSPGGE